MNLSQTDKNKTINTLTSQTSSKTTSTTMIVCILSFLLNNKIAHHFVSSVEEEAKSNSSIQQPQLNTEFQEIQSVFIFINIILLDD